MLTDNFATSKAKNKFFIIMRYLLCREIAELNQRRIGITGH
ncbi:hypothetical protein Leryth_002962 [Lithospermum erythrorhizon]|nr:hypothetical protein Leryth_002962 [Lithospermum erythrorhizon]